CPLLEDARHAPMIIWVENKRKRHLEHRGYFERISRERKRYPDDADHRDDLETRPGHVSVEPTDHRHMIARQADLLLGLAQRRLLRVAIARLYPPAGERDLPGVRAQMRGPLGQQNGHTAGAVDKRNQHRRRPQFGARRRPPRIEIMVATRRAPEGSGFSRVRSAAKATSSGLPEMREARDH